MTSKKQYKIVAGPSREELFDALRLRHEGRTVTFTVVPDTQLSGSLVSKSNQTVRVLVDELGIEDGSGNNWLFKLYDAHAVLGANYLDGYINLTKRTGWIRPVG